jgi:hypothetical protein
MKTLKDIIIEIEEKNKDELEAEKFSVAIGDYIADGDELKPANIGIEKLPKNEKDNVERKLDNIEKIADELSHEIEKDSDTPLNEDVGAFMAGFLAALAKNAYTGSIKGRLTKYFKNPRIQKLMDKYQKSITDIKDAKKALKQKYPHIY